MHITTSKKPLLSLENIAMTDIVMNMFIFFFIAFSLLYTFNPQRMAKIDVKLPTASNVQVPDEAKQVTIVVSERGELFFNQKKMTMREVKDNLEISARRNPDISVMIVSDKSAPFKYIVEILDTLTGLGVTRLSIAATKDQG
jgi:biopolymer transport protein ExbD